MIRFNSRGVRGQSFLSTSDADDATVSSHQLLDIFNGNGTFHQIRAAIGQFSTTKTQDLVTHSMFKLF